MGSCVTHAGAHFLELAIETGINVMIGLSRRYCLAGLVLAMTSACAGGEGTSPSSSLTQTESPGEWQLVWSDEFDGSTIDSAKWNVLTDCWGGGNDEQQCYTARPRNVVVADGALQLIARHESFTGSAEPEEWSAPQGSPAAERTLPFTSGKVTTRGKAAWRYGRIEMRARLPQGQGTWPAFWMMPADSAYGGWPLSGEIDIFEAVNLGVVCEDCEEGGENSVLGTLHYGAPPPDNAHSNREIAFPGVLDGEFHTYGVIWEEGRFTWTIDGEAFGTQVASDWWTAASETGTAPFDREFYLILNLAIGGNWPESTALGGVSSENFPKRMEIDWVRVWQCGGDAATGHACTEN